MSPQDFVFKILELDIRNIHRTQKPVISERIYVKAKDLKVTRRKIRYRQMYKRLEDSVTNQDYAIQG